MGEREEGNEDKNISIASQRAAANNYSRTPPPLE